MPNAILNRGVVACGSLLLLAAGRANAQTHWRDVGECAGEASGTAAGLAIAQTQDPDILEMVLWVTGGFGVGGTVGHVYGARADDRLAIAEDLSPTQRGVLRSTAVICSAALGAALAAAVHSTDTQHQLHRITVGAVAGAAAGLYIEQRFFDRSLWPQPRRLDIRVVPLRRGLALVVNHN